MNTKKEKLMRTIFTEDVTLWAIFAEEMALSEVAHIMQDDEVSMDLDGAAKTHDGERAPLRI